MGIGRPKGSTKELKCDGCGLPLHVQRWNQIANMALCLNLHCTKYRQPQATHQAALPVNLLDYCRYRN